LPFVYGAFTLYGGPFQAPLTRQAIGNSSARPQTDRTTPHNPGKATPAGLTPSWFGLDPRSLAATDGIAIAFSSWGY
jgi:hypothetical protein